LTGLAPVSTQPGTGSSGTGTQKALANAAVTVRRVVWNPIVAKELRSRMQGWHALALLTGYLCVIGTVGYVVYAGYSGSSGNVIETSDAGSALFRALALAVMASIALVVPGLVGPAISGERERQTLELLLVTPLGPARIVLGKLVAALALMGLLVLACSPLFSVAFLLGGVAPTPVLELFAFALVVTLCLGSLSMFASVALQRVGPATVVSYLAMLVLMAGPLMASYGLQGAFPSTDNSNGVTEVSGRAGAPGVVVAISPVAGAADLLGSGPCGVNGFLPVISPNFVLIGGNCGAELEYTTSLGPLGTVQTWQASVGFDGVIALAGLGASVVMLRRREPS
jgi:ABC-type transport system involved in multi-copper enzyme maturation permease subunit